MIPGTVRGVCGYYFAMLLHASYCGKKITLQGGILSFYFDIATGRVQKGKR